MKDAPDIRMTEETGYPAPVCWPRCPVCGMECETIYINCEGEAVGCDECIETRSTWDYMEEYG